MRGSLLRGTAAALVAVAAGGWQGARFSLGNIMDRFATKAHRSTSQAGANYPKHPPGTVAQSKRAAIKSKNRAKHRAHMKGRA